MLMTFDKEQLNADVKILEEKEISKEAAVSRPQTLSHRHSEFLPHFVFQ